MYRRTAGIKLNPVGYITWHDSYPISRCYIKIKMAPPSFWNQAMNWWSTRRADQGGRSDWRVFCFVKWTIESKIILFSEISWSIHKFAADWFDCFSDSSLFSYGTGGVNWNLTSRFKSTLLATGCRLVVLVHECLTRPIGWIYLVAVWSWHVDDMGFVGLTSPFFEWSWFTRIRLW